MYSPKLPQPDVHIFCVIYGIWRVAYSIRPSLALLVVSRPFSCLIQFFSLERLIQCNDFKARRSNSRLCHITQPAPLLRKVNFLIWDRIWPAHGYVQTIGGQVSQLKFDNFVVHRHLPDLVITNRWSNSHPAITLFCSGQCLFSSAYPIRLDETYKT